MTLYIDTQTSNEVRGCDTLGGVATKECWEILMELVYYKISEGGTSWLNKKFVFV